MKIKVVASNPDQTKGYEQDDIRQLVGNVYDVLHYDEEDNSVSVYEDKWKGEIVLNKDEYEIIEIGTERIAEEYDNENWGQIEKPYDEV